MTTMRSLSKYKAIVFDLGGTLMEYEGMPLDWSVYYPNGFRNIISSQDLSVSEMEIIRASEIMRYYNPRYSHREVEYTPERIFTYAVEDWRDKPDIKNAINEFFEGIELRPKIFDYTIDLLDRCSSRGLKTACLTDLPNGMPDRIFKKAITDIIGKLDLYVSSQNCGYRKPNKAGLVIIADMFKVDIKDVLFVGDEKKDRLTAYNAGCDFMYINEVLR